jgi:hypothetical protein
MEPLAHAAREMIVSDVSCAAGKARNNSLAGAVLALQHNVPRWAAEAATSGPGNRVSLHLPAE